MVYLYVEVATAISSLSGRSDMKKIVLALGAIALAAYYTRNKRSASADCGNGRAAAGGAG